MPPTIPERLLAAEAGSNPNVICRMGSGWLVLCDMQFLSGYCILMADPAVTSLNDLGQAQRAQFLTDMAMAGDALLEVTGAYRINYTIAGNTDPYLHAHIVPRFLSEPEARRKGLPWSYSEEEMDSNLFDAERDRLLMEKLRAAVLKRLPA